MSLWLSLYASGLFFQFTCPVCLYQCLELLDLPGELLTLIGILDIHPAFEGLHCPDDRRMELLCTVRLQRTVWFVLCKSHISRIKNERISSNSRLFLICLGHTSVNHDQLSFTLYRTLTVFYLYGHMAIEYMRCLWIQTEFRKYFLAYVFPVYQLIVIYSMLFVGLLVCNETPFEGRHLILSEQR